MCNDKQCCGGGAHNKKNYGLLVLRIVLGIIFIAHGWQKIQGMEGTIQFFGMLGFSAFWAYVATYAEFLGGIAVILGIFTRIGGFLIAITMAVVALKVMHGVPLLSSASGPGLEFPLGFFGIAGALAIMGGGRFSLDTLLWKKCKGHTASACDGCNECAGGICSGHESKCDNCDGCKTGCTKHETK